MVICHANIPGTFGLCVLEKGHAGPHSVEQGKKPEATTEMTAQRDVLADDALDWCKEVQDELVVALEDSRLSLLAIQRNKDILVNLLNAAGLPSGWLSAIAPKVSRAEAVLRKAGRLP